MSLRYTIWRMWNPKKNTRLCGWHQGFWNFRVKFFGSSVILQVSCYVHQYVVYLTCTPNPWFDFQVKCQYNKSWSSNFLIFYPQIFFEEELSIHQVSVRFNKRNGDWSVLKSKNNDQITWCKNTHDTFILASRVRRTVLLTRKQKWMKSDFKYVRIFQEK